MGDASDEMCSRDRVLQLAPVFGYLVERLIINANPTVKDASGKGINLLRIRVFFLECFARRN